MEFEETVTIQRPVEEVFAYMSNAENDAKWRTNVKEIRQVTEGEKGVGTEYRQVVKGPMGKGLDADLRYTEFKPNERVAFETIAGSVRPSAVIEFKALSADSTQVHMHMTWVPEGGAKAGAPMIKRMIEKDLKASYANLVKMMESR